MADPVTLVEDPPGSGLYVPPDEGDAALVLESPAGSGLYLVGSLDGETIYTSVEGPVGLYWLATGVLQPLRPTTWSVALCNGWQPIGECVAYRFQGVHRYTEPGEWLIETSPAGVDFGWHEVDGEWVQWTPQDVENVWVVEDGRPVFAGFCGQVSQGVGGFRSVKVGDEERWTFGGPDLWAALLWRLAFPDPSTAPPWGDPHHVETGTASDVITEYLLDNIGSSALEDREYAGLSIINGGVGLESTWSARLQPLAELVRRIARDADIGVWLTMSTSSDLTVRVGTPMDRSAYLELSDLDDLSRIEAAYLPATATWALSGGAGEGTSRVFRVSDTEATGWDRREQFADISALSNAAEVQADADARTRLGAAQYRILVELTDEAAARINYPHDISLGDLVSVVVDGTQYVLPLMAAEFELTADRRRVRPVFGAAVPNALKGFVLDQANLAARFDNTIA